MALPVVEEAGAEVAGVEHGVDLGGGRSSGELGVGVREHGRRRGGCLRVHAIVLSTMVGSGASCGGCGHGHAMAGGEKLSAEVGKLGRGGERRGFQGEKEEWLT